MAVCTRSRTISHDGSFLGRPKASNPNSCQRTGYRWDEILSHDIEVDHPIVDGHGNHCNEDSDGGGSSKVAGEREDLRLPTDDRPRLATADDTTAALVHPLDPRTDNRRHNERASEERGRENDGHSTRQRTHANNDYEDSDGRHAEG